MSSSNPLSGKVSFVPHPTSSRRQLSLSHFMTYTIKTFSTRLHTLIFIASPTNQSPLSNYWIIINPMMTNLPQSNSKCHPTYTNHSISKNLQSSTHTHAHDLSSTTFKQVNDDSPKIGEISIPHKSHLLINRF